MSATIQKTRERNDYFSVLQKIPLRSYIDISLYYFARYSLRLIIGVIINMPTKPIKKT